MKAFKLRTILFCYLTLLLAISIIAVGLFSSEIMVEYFALSRVDVLAQVSARLSEMEKILRTTSNIYFQDKQLLQALADEPHNPWVAEDLARLRGLTDVISVTSGFPTPL